MRSLITTIVKRAGTIAALTILVAAAFGAGYLLRAAPQDVQPASPSAAHEHESEAEQLWTCAMHPQIKLPEPGKCPICAMDLVPLVAASGTSEMSSAVFETTPAVAALMNIRTAAVERRFVPTTVRMVGMVDYDETKLSHITAWVPGRLEHLFVDYTGVSVQEGDHMVEIYSPDLLTAEEELWRAAQSVKRLSADSPGSLRRTAEATLEASRRKLALWGLTEDQIAEAEKNGVTSDRVTIYAPSGGTVVQLTGGPGMYVDTGSHIYTIADLSEVWVKLEAYESDLAWLHFGQDVIFTTEAYPGTEFRGKIAFIDPVLDTTTRTVDIRVNVANDNSRLKPGMFVRARIRALTATAGRVMDPQLAGKWIGPMHPQIVKDGPGACDICGMDLVTAESLGYVSAITDDSAKPLVIPATAPLLTGKRAVVYVELPDRDTPTYEGREVVLGARAGEFYIVHEGLAEGERVVVNGNFKIDSALEILGQPSMMNPEGGQPAGTDHSGH